MAVTTMATNAMSTVATPRSSAGRILTTMKPIHLSFGEVIQWQYLTSLFLPFVFVTKCCENRVRAKGMRRSLCSDSSF